MTLEVYVVMNRVLLCWGSFAFPLIFCPCWPLKREQSTSNLQRTTFWTTNGSTSKIQTLQNHVLSGSPPNQLHEEVIVISLFFSHFAFYLCVLHLINLCVCSLLNPRNFWNPPYVWVNFILFFLHGLPRISFQKKEEIFPHPTAFDEFITMALEDHSYA